jgi:hypothetical protein
MQNKLRKYFEGKLSKQSCLQPSMCESGFSPFTAMKTKFIPQHDLQYACLQWNYALNIFQIKYKANAHTNFAFCFNFFQVLQFLCFTQVFFMLPVIYLFGRYIKFLYYCFILKLHSHGCNCLLLTMFIIYILTGVFISIIRYLPIFTTIYM